MNRKTRDVLSLRALEDLLLAVLGEPSDHPRFDRVGVARAIPLGLEELTFGPLGISHRALGAGPEALGRGAEADPSALARIEPRQAGFLALEELVIDGRALAVVRVNADRGPRHAPHREPLAQIDVLTFAGAFAMEQRSHRGSRRGEPGQVVGLAAGGLEWRLVGK